MLKIGKTFHIDSAHYLPGHPKCGEPHGHTWTIDLSLTAKPSLSEEAMLLDFHTLSEVASKVLKPFDHTTLNSLEVFTSEPPTVENLTRVLSSRFLQKLLLLPVGPLLHSITLKIQEGTGGYAERTTFLGGEGL